MSLLLDVMKQRNTRSANRALSSTAQAAAPAAAHAVPNTDAVVQDTSAYDKYKLDDLIPIWNKHDKPTQLTSHILKRLDKTIKAAMTSYAGQVSDALAVPAANIVIDALQSYDPKKGASIQTHVFNSLRRLSRVGAQRKNIIHIPQGVSADIRTVAKATHKLTEELGQQPDIDQLSQYTGLSKKRIQSLQRGAIVSQSTAQVTNQNKDIGASSDISDAQYTRYVHSTLGHTDKKILQWSTGIYGQPVLPVNTIASKLGISAAAVSQRRAKIQSQLQQIRGLI